MKCLIQGRLERRSKNRGSENLLIKWLIITAKAYQLPIIRHLVIVSAEGDIEPIAFIFQIAACEMAFHIGQRKIECAVRASPVAYVSEVIGGGGRAPFCKRKVQDRKVVW